MKLSLALLNTIVLAAALMGSAAFAEDISPLTTVVVNGQSILADATGLVLYTYDPDKLNDSNCYNGCAKAWPPLSLPASDALSAPLGRAPRTDGSEQVTYEGKPLYYYVGDSQPDQANGDGLGGVWHVIQIQ